MHKKLIAACLALIALAAFALPAAAQATNNPVVTHPTGTVLNPTGKTCTTGLAGICIKATNVGETLMTETNNTANVQLACTKAEMTGALQTNTTGNVVGEIHSASFSGTGSPDCTGAFANVIVDVLSLPWCLKSNTTMGEDEWKIFGGACSGAAKKIEFRLTPTLVGGECLYQSTTTTGAQGFFTTHATGEALLSTGGAHPANGYTKIIDTSFGHVCPSSTELGMKFTLETDETTANPLYISP